MTAMSRNARRREMRRLQRFEQNHARDLDRAMDAADYWRNKARALEFERDALSEKLRSVSSASRRPDDLSFLREAPDDAEYEVPLIGHYETVRVRL